MYMYILYIYMYIYILMCTYIYISFVHINIYLYIYSSYNHSVLPQLYHPHIYMHRWKSAYTGRFSCMYADSCVRRFLDENLHVYTDFHLINLRVYADSFMYIHTHIFMYASIHINSYIYINIHIDIYVYACTCIYIYTM